MSDMFPTVLLNNWVASLDAAVENREQNAVAERKKNRKSLSFIYYCSGLCIATIFQVRISSDLSFSSEWNVFFSDPHHAYGMI